MTDDHRELFSGGKPFISGAAGDSRSSAGTVALQQPALPSAFKAFPSLSLLFLQFSRSGRQPVSRGPRSPGSCLPSSSPPFSTPAYLPRGDGFGLPAPRPPQLRHGDTDTQTQGLSPPWARQETVPNTSKRSAVRN